MKTIQINDLTTASLTNHAIFSNIAASLSLKPLNDSCELDLPSLFSSSHVLSSYSCIEQPKQHTQEKSSHPIIRPRVLTTSGSDSWGSNGIFRHY